MIKLRRLVLILFLTVVSLHVFGQTVYVTKTGKKYHTENCRYLKDSKIAISLKDANAKGYLPCKVCNPPIYKATGTKTAEPTPETTPKIKAPAADKVRTGCICRDGTESTATGRGACSHHGGVDHWLYK
jgi:hypothetical protein